MLKEINPQELYNSIKETLSGGAVNDAIYRAENIEIAQRTSGFRNGRRKRKKITLTAREIQVLEQLSKGLNINAIAGKSLSFLKERLENMWKIFTLNYRFIIS